MALRFNVRVDIDPSRIEGNAERAQEILANQVMQDTDKFVPKRTGNLSTRTRVQGNQVVYPGPYARYLYHGKLMVDPETGSAYARKGSTKMLTEKPLNLKGGNPQAQAEWFEASKSLNLDKWERVFARAVTRG